MNSNATSKNVSWPHFSWPTLYILEDLHPLGGKNVSNMCDLFEDDYKEFVVRELNELCDIYY